MRHPEHNIDAVPIHMQMAERNNGSPVEVVKKTKLTVHSSSTMCYVFMASIAYRSIAVRIFSSLNLMGGTWMVAVREVVSLTLN